MLPDTVAKANTVAAADANNAAATAVANAVDATPVVAHGKLLKSFNNRSGLTAFNALC